MFSWNQSRKTSASLTHLGNENCRSLILLDCCARTLLPFCPCSPLHVAHTNQWIPARRTLCTGTDLRVIKGSSSHFPVTAVSVSSISTSKCNRLNPLLPSQPHGSTHRALQVFLLPQHLCRLKQEFCCKLAQELLCNVFSVFVTPSTSPVPGIKALGNLKSSLSLPIPSFTFLTTPVTTKGSLPLLERSPVHPPEPQRKLQPIFCKLLLLPWKNSQEPISGLIQHQNSKLSQEEEDLLLAHAHN